ncbi:tartrate dehydrogenase [Rhinocladiella mackenziei CBS 650.93]|uniref:Rhinocladiella mackenziei CBS 650.93 unplaced genomic scaffold supercont1.5, whole genome shotgun sequence n=1 Tax=Rhinocladiella mackenziei CBS 650.93 TaxID=1442369 RepID=A0A0D2IAV8_9EURO|nr:tartrate dehydrogenase [Rhinocladiella mackenziei CBS 650.93]KIX02964.1 tartrate dehydrogenase [Rhinocladiella mackenziei CBS 650.93]
MSHTSEQNGTDGAAQNHHYRIASIPADGIGPEVVRAAIDVVNQVSQTLGTFTVEFTHIPWGTAYYKEHGRYVDENVLDVLRSYDAGLFGAVGAPDVPDHISLWGLLLAIRGPLQLYANVRPVRSFPGTETALRRANNEDINWLLVRENSEGEYSGQGGRSHRGQTWETATEVSIFTYVGIERIMRFAFEAAQARPRKLLTVVTKSNSMRNGMVLWDEVAAKVAKDFPDVKWDKMLVDAMTVRMVNNPKSLDTIVGTNLHMDILSDLAAALAGSIGVAPSSNLDPTRKNPSLFEPVHGSAFDITGKGIANPVATFWSAAEMLAWLGEKDAAKVMMTAVEQVCKAGILSPDLGGKANTREVTEAVCEEVKRLGSSTKTPIPSVGLLKKLQFGLQFLTLPISYPRYFLGQSRHATFSTIDGAQGTEGWRWLFVIEGVVTFSVALISTFRYGSSIYHSTAFRKRSYHNSEENNLRHVGKTKAQSALQSPRVASSDPRLFLLALT